MLVGAIAEFKRNIIKKRQPEGIELAKMRGAFKGSARRISGEKVSHMKHLIKEGVSLAKTARIIGISRTSAYRYLKANNPENATKVGIQRISREGDNSASGSKL
jgi:DNA invertase Pin-like site-specific DNA recombinase